MNSNPILRKLLWPLCLLSALAAGCTHDEADIVTLGGVDPETVTVEMRIPGPGLPVTRSAAAPNQAIPSEAAVETLDLLVFDRSAPMPRLLETFQPAAADLRQSAAGPYYTVSFEAPSALFKDAGTLVAVANAAETVRTAIYGNTSQVPIRTAKGDILSLLQLLSLHWEVPAGSDPIPMYGEMAIQNPVAGGTTLGEIQLIRMLARIDVRNLVDAATFRLRRIHLVNYVIWGYIPPAWNRQTGALYKPGESGYVYETGADPVLPLAAARPDRPVQYDYPQPATGPGPLLAATIYTFETESGATLDPEHRVGLILEGLYQGAPCFYRVDFTNERGDLIPLYRNHKYVVTITAAEGPGYTTFDEALKAGGVLSNLRTTLLTVDMSGINEMVYNGQYFMGVERYDYEVKASTTQELNIKVYTNYRGPWSATVLDPGKAPWVRLLSVRGVVTGDTFVIPVRVTNMPSGAVVEIMFTAGRLQDTVAVWCP